MAFSHNYRQIRKGESKYAEDITHRQVGTECTLLLAHRLDYLDYYFCASRTCLHGYAVHARNTTAVRTAAKCPYPRNVCGRKRNVVSIGGVFVFVHPFIDNGNI